MLKKTCAVLMSCLVLGAATVPAWAAETGVSVKTVSRTENKVDVECPQVSGGSRTADDKINRALSSQVASFVSEASTLGGGKVHYDVHKSDEDLVSFTLVMTPNMGVEESVGMTFDRKTGELRPLSYYYTKDQLAVLAQNGLQYLYDVDPAKLQTIPDTYYVDRDGSLIGVYHAGAVLDKSEGEIEINLSAAGMDAEGNVTETPIDHSSAAPAETAAPAGTEAKPAETPAAGENSGKGLERIRARLAVKEKAQDEAKAKAEAKACFGDDEMYLEKLVLGPRHIEFQILADNYGHVIHLGERDCSIQRNHQKMIEESPSLALSEELRQKMGEAAVKAAKAANYENAGTIEFLLEKNGSFYFMEMNTRIQVEHPVTEWVTGIDLVKEQIRIASGEHLKISQEDVKLTGHAIECRINAENPAKNFRPSPGTITDIYLPGGKGVRIDSAIYSGYTVPPYYDSMLAKLIVHAKSRPEAISKMRSALGEVIIEGIDTNIDYLYELINHPDYQSGNIDIEFIERL